MPSQDYDREAAAIILFSTMDCSAIAKKASLVRISVNSRILNGPNAEALQTPNNKSRQIKHGVAKSVRWLEINAISLIHI